MFKAWSLSYIYLSLLQCPYMASASLLFSIGYLACSLTWLFRILSVLSGHHLYIRSFFQVALLGLHNYSVFIAKMEKKISWQLNLYSHLSYYVDFYWLALFIFLMIIHLFTISLPFFSFQVFLVVVCVSLPPLSLII